MTQTFKRIIIACIALIVIAGAASALVVSGGCSSKDGSPIENAKNGTLNTIIDASGIKGKIDSELHDRAGAIAEQMGVSQSMVDNVIDSLAIEDWQVASLPENASATGSFSFDVQGTTAQITTYDDPSIVTVNALGQSITMEIPESAQGYAALLGYLDTP